MGGLVPAGLATASYTNPQKGSYMPCKALAQTHKFWGMLLLLLTVSLVWTVVVVVEEMLCANSKVRLLAHDDLTWNNNLSYAIPQDIL